MLLTALWGALALAVDEGMAVLIQTGGILLLETFGAYLLGRCLIRDYSSFERMVQLLFFIVAFMLPFALLENFTGRAFILELIGKSFTTFPKVNMDPRWGLDRAQGLFEHPILFGVVCSAAFGLVTYVVGKWSRSGLIAMAVGSSLSAGALVSLILQVVLIIWNRATRGVQYRWGILGVLFAAGFFAVDLLSHRTAFEVFVTYFTFNGDYYRILIWDFGSQEVLRHPVFGLGLHDWIRPDCMGGSVDNFWLATAMAYGLPGFFLLASAVFTVFVKLSRLKNLGDNVESCRTGLLISLAGIVMALSTVDLWKASYCLFFFLLGSGFWMLEETAPKLARTSAIRIRKPAPYVRYRQWP
jgi:hypothetical protein